MAATQLTIQCTRSQLRCAIICGVAALLYTTKIAPLYWPGDWGVRPKRRMIVDTLEKIDQALQNNFYKVYESLQPGATDDELALLKVCFPSNQVPEEIVSLYKWHNGQLGSYSLNQKDNRTFLPIDEVVSSWEFLNDPMEDISEPLSKTWVPILYNGAGDYLMYETEGADKGKILSYWHDSKRREVVYKNLKELEQEVLSAAMA
ncbi:MAG: SMI1/KNR4 family protein [Candidatus Thiodiazotropha sp.]